jgi:NADPH-dependent glutamate synthase beta subunit-like oxidoreductase/NAD-dependent dihydropyrimidine dehydrogenase PreA subunit
MLGGKIASVIPESRIPAEVVTAELERAQAILPHIHLQQNLTAKEVSGLAEDYAFIVIAVGAQKPRMLDVPGNERIIPALDFLTQAKSNAITPGKRVVVIGAGNVGCDVATEAHRLGAEDILLIDVQEPASYGAERDAAEAIGARFQWPCFTAAITEQGVALTTGEVLPADTVIISIGDQPELNFLPPEVATEGGFIVVNEHYQTTASRIFAIGDAVKPGLLTDAIGSGRKAAAAIIDLLEGRRPVHDTRQMIDMQRVNLEYYDPRITEFEDVAHCGSSCASCGACRDCGICSTICPVGAISRLAKIGNEYEYVVDDALCIGCGFCAGACPCGVWDLVENTPMD